MNNYKTKISTRTIISRNKLKLTTLLLTIQVLFTACASQSHKGSFVHTILKKENELIEKIKAERATEGVRSEIEKSENLKKAEVHLLVSLEEIQKANAVVTQKLLNPTLEEVKNGKNERTNN